MIINEAVIPSGAEVSIGIGKGGGELSEVAVEGGGETFERDAKVFVEGFEDGEWEGSLRPVPFVGLRPHVGQVALEQAPDTR